MFLRATLVWLPMQLLAFWGQVWVLRVAYSGGAAQAVVMLGTLAGIAAIAWSTQSWITENDDLKSRASVGALWAGATLAVQVGLAVNSFGTWSSAGYALTVGGMLNLGNLSVVMLLALPVAAYWRHRPITEPSEPAPPREAPRQDLVVATAPTN